MGRRIAVTFLIASLLCACLSASIASADGGGDGVYVELPLTDCSDEWKSNVAQAIARLGGVNLRYGDSFSFLELVGPITEERGYQVCENSAGQSIVGGGVEQAATAIYLAMMQRDDIEYRQIRTYDESFQAAYTSSGYDAVMIDEGQGIDFRFVCYSEAPLSLSLWSGDNSACCMASSSAESAPSAGAQMAAGPIGYASTRLTGSAAHTGNIELAASAVFGTVIEPYGIFSFNEIVGPRSARDGYLNAVNGRGVMVTGGGVAQLASTIYMAVKDLPCVEIREIQTYGKDYVGTYVDEGEYAVATDESAGLDFSFLYLGDQSLTIYAYTTESDELICEVYEGE